jgi:hypothetical protein
MAALVWLAIGTLVLWDSYRKKPAKKPVDANCSKKIGGNKNYQDVAEKAYRDACYAQEQRHRATEQIYWFVSILLTFGAVVGSVYGITIARDALQASREQASAAQAQLDAIRDEQRPWILISDLDDEGTVINDWRGGTGNAVIHYAITNYGHDPALIISSACIEIVLPGPPDKLQMMATNGHVYDLRSVQSTSQDQILVAGQTGPKVSCAAWPVGDGIPGIIVPGLHTMEVRRKIMDENAFWVVGLIRYQQPGGSLIYETTFCLHLVGDIIFEKGGSGECNKRT